MGSCIILNTEIIPQCSVKSETSPPALPCVFACVSLCWNEVFRITSPLADPHVWGYNAYLLLTVVSLLSCQHEEVVLSLMGIVLSLQLVNDAAAESQQKRAGVKRFAGSSSGEENEEEEEEEEEGEESRGAPLGKQRKKGARGYSTGTVEGVQWCVQKRM